MPRQWTGATFYASAIKVSTSNSMLEKTFFPRTASVKHANETYLNSSVASLSAARAEEGRHDHANSPRWFATRK
jgi:hypothetical protein